MAVKKKARKKAGLPARKANGFPFTKPLLIAALVLLTLSCEAISRGFGVGASLGNGFQLAAIPALLALFLLGYDYAIYTIVLSALLLPAVGINGYEVIARVASWLPVPAVAGFAWLAAEGKWGRRYSSSMFFGFFAALLIFQAAAMVAPALPVSNPFAPLPEITAAQPSAVYIFLSLGEILLGAFPVAILAAFSGLVLIKWLKNEAGKPGRLLGNLKELATLAVIAIPVKAAATVAVYYYYAGPPLSGLTPALLLAAQPIGIVLAGALAGGVVELAFAWSIAKIARPHLQLREF